MIMFHRDRDILIFMILHKLLHWWIAYLQKSMQMCVYMVSFSKWTHPCGLHHPGRWLESPSLLRSPLTSALKVMLSWLLMLSICFSWFWFSVEQDAPFCVWLLCSAFSFSTQLCRWVWQQFPLRLYIFLLCSACTPKPNGASFSS